MTAKAYYLTTLGDWQRHAGRFASSHWLALDQAIGEAHAQSADAAPHSGTRILVLVEADEGAHLALEGDAAFEALPHPLALRPVSEAAQTALAAISVAPGATTFDAAEAAARVHPLLRHRVF
ncbi:MAG TPA: hypothetical protein VNK23_14435 [Candidatus Dormibacteraeota bacterium]|nr:hypothetical protein [Candidatus Dormibacteraeota bacterium]